MCEAIQNPNCFFIQSIVTCLTFSKPSYIHHCVPDWILSLPHFVSDPDWFHYMIYFDKSNASVLLN